MSIPTVEFYRGAALNFNETMADTKEAERVARESAFVAYADETADYRFRQLPSNITSRAYQHGTTPTENIAWVLSEAFIIEDAADLDDEYVVDVSRLAGEIYAKAAEQGLDERPGAINFINALAGRLEGELGIVTTSSREDVVSFLKEHDLSGIVDDDHIIAAGDTVSPGPSAEVYRLMQTRLGIITAKRMLVIESTPLGVQAAKEMGSTVLAVRGSGMDGLSKLEGLRDPGLPDQIATSFQAAKTALNIK